MSQLYWRRLPMAVVGLCLSRSPALSVACPSETEQAAQAAAVTLTDWSGVRSFFELYENCDDGGVADDVTQAVVTLLATRWDEVPRLAALIHQDAKFGAFVLSHIDTTADTDDLIEIRTLAAKKCRPDLQSLCNEIGQAALRAQS
jgi:hypothetical protein